MANGPYYWVKKEFAEYWGTDYDILVTEEEIEDLAREWGKTVDELKEQLVELF